MNAPAKQMLQPPHAIEPEQNVLGALLLDASVFDDVRSIVCADDFYRADHQIVFRGIEEMIRNRAACDFVTLAEHLRNQGRLDDAGGIAYIGTLAADTYRMPNVRHYAEIVRERSLLRTVIGIGTDLAQAGYRPEGRNHSEILGEAESNIARIRARSIDANQTSVGMDVVMDAVERCVEERRKNPTVCPGLSTGFTDIDRRTTGLHPGDVMLVAGRPSMGKTSFAMNIAENVAVFDKKPVAVFSMEMSAEQLGQRIVASVGRISLEHLRSGHLDEAMFQRLSHVSGMVRAAPLHIDETAALSPHELSARARRLKQRHDIKLIVIDYLQLMQVPGNDENRTNELAEISRAIKRLAKDLAVPIIALSQLNRGVEQRTNKRPRMADLRESGGLEQDADIVAMIYRDEVYNPASEHKGVAEILFEKQRNGPTGLERTAWQPQFCRFDNLAPEYYREDRLGGFE